MRGIMLRFPRGYRESENRQRKAPEQRGPQSVIGSISPSRTRTGFHAAKANQQAL